MSNSCTRASTASSSGRLSFASSEIISFALTEGELFELTLDESELHVNLTANPVMVRFDSISRRPASRPAKKA
jgi:hypothetical protein